MQNLIQTLICALIIGAALLYVLNRWLPTRWKQRLLPWTAKLAPPAAQGGGCGSCSSCQGCDSGSGKLMNK